MRLFKRHEHHWHEVVTRKEKEYYHDGLGIDYDEFLYTYAYCPLCRKRKKIHSKEWEILKEEQRIRQEYKDKK